MEKKKVAWFAPVHGYITVDIDKQLVERHPVCDICGAPLEENLKASVEEATDMIVHLASCRKRLILQRISESDERNIGTLMQQFNRGAHTILNWLVEVKNGR